MAWIRRRFRNRTFWLDENSLEVTHGDDPPDKMPAPVFQHRKTPVHPPL